MKHSLIRLPHRSVPAFLAASAFAAACGSSAAKQPSGAAPTAATQAPAPPAASAAPRPTYGTFGFDTDGMDRSVAPGQDFYRFANGGWHDRTEIPADRASYGLFVQLADQNDGRVRELIEAAASAAPSDEARKIGDAYAAFMDEAAIEARGKTPLEPELARIAAIANRRQLAAELGGQLRADVDPLNTSDMYTGRLFGVWVAEDLNDPSRYAAYLLQGGLGLPDRDHYLADGARHAAIRDQYRRHIAAMLGLAGVSEPAARAGRIVELERKIAAVHWTTVESYKVRDVNNPWPRTQFARKARGVDWKGFFEAAGLAGESQIIVWQPSALIGISRLVASQPLQTWRDYLTFHAVARAARFLPRAFVDESFALTATLYGVTKQRDRWKRAIEFSNEVLGEAIGKLYVAKYFPPEAKAAADAMVAKIVESLRRRIADLSWMTRETKTRALAKVATLQVGIGHPARWRDYSALEIARDDAYGNAERAERFEYRRALAKLGRPVDRSEWFMVPQRVNALNSPQQNSIIFPAAILQPPFFDPNADPAVNYGGIGSVIGHEIIHSFDDLGAEFDAQGRLANWWTPEDQARFKAAGRALIAQYSAYKPFPDQAVNGELTLGENTADLAGVAIAFDGYRLSLAGKSAPVRGGFTGDQRFFLGYAQIWRRKFRDQARRHSLATDVHAPGEYRVATVRNQDAWYDAFEVAPGQPLYLAPEQRVRIW